MLSQYFPKRYFILKSLTQFDLDLSVEKGLWATQKHNEGILDQAYRTAKDVYLIFSVNKSGEFYGYARMAGPILHGEQRVSWASRSSLDSPPTRRASASAAPESSPATGRGSTEFFSPSDGDRYEESPLPLDSASRPFETKTPTGKWGAGSAPTVMYEHYRPLSKQSAGVPRHGELSYDQNRLMPIPQAMVAQQQEKADNFELDESAPARAIKHRSSGGSFVDADGIRRWDAAVSDSLDSVREEEEHGGESSKGKGRAVEGEEAKEDGPVWGESFKVEWIKTERLPFYHTRHLRNLWNHDREVKVSRDGTELEPGVGQALLEEWDKPDPGPPQGQQPPRSGAKSSPLDRAAAGQQGGTG